MLVYPGSVFWPRPTGRPRPPQALKSSFFVTILKYLLTYISFYLLPIVPAGTERRSHLISCRVSWKCLPVDSPSTGRAGDKQPGRGSPPHPYSSYAPSSGAAATRLNACVSMKALSVSVFFAVTSPRRLPLSSAFAQLNIHRHRLKSARPATSNDMETDAAALDAELMSTPGFSLEQRVDSQLRALSAQLMELAGLSVAEAVYDVLSGHEGKEDQRKKHVLLVCGPGRLQHVHKGNNGGDGLVAARHLVHFGFDATIVYPKRSPKQHFINLVKQCEDLDIPILDDVPIDSTQRFDSVVDAIFGFSFRSGGIREPFATAIVNLVELQKKQDAVLVSVDVPSGWDVDGGDLTGGANFHPDVLISLTAPKLSARQFVGRHYIGGRFLPPALAQRYNIKFYQMPSYAGCKQSIEVMNANQDRANWAQAYQDYLNEKESGNARKEEISCTDSSDSSRVDEEEDWAAAYQAYCEEKEKEFFENTANEN
ncbi:hypothetical protein THAOC_21799 [Thalassiosira oceanica]|uniref:NAD(P)H-hydrate epimerase n=1 Tax=Thalassiosira oceanica TaxID=159749 RepID=K0RYK2_THAOC|nr:hypothetical protein THAOC_21799 [Thalassiosira oceanica]|eukprot:EJK58100.1 hypothetical protein THAOC_21799 [Thalassiosira oceanica]